MAQTWFLDLDGIKSGPYQNHEVLNLVTEGEVMPHHKIAPNLKTGPWISILEWRLEQSKKEEAAVTRPHLPEVSEVKIDESLIPGSSTSATPPVPPYMEVPSTNKETQEQKEKLKAYQPHPLDKPSKDPTAEMFALLQSTKQKREKQATEAEVLRTQEISSHASRPTNSNFKNIGIALIIILAGIALGQWFQGSNETPSEASKTQTSASSIAVTSPSNQNAEAESPSGDVRTLKTDLGKITIQSKSRPSNDIQKPTHSESLAPEEMKEIGELKKELQELKKLKEELKNSRDNDLEYDDGAILESGDDGDFGPPDDANVAPNPNTSPGAKRPIEDPNIVY